MSFTWNGRQMATAQVVKTENNLTTTTNISYTYDADGLRTTKQVGSTLHEYEYVGDQLVYEKRGDLKFYYRYNAMGELASIKRIDTSENTETSVYVITNTRGDIEELRLANGDLVARYVYDTWGNILHIYDANGNDVKNDTTHIGVQNPFRYRSYYYDAESGLYYLQSRYYDPVVGRFISADNQIAGVGGDILGYNLFAYCQNNPVNASDENGNWPNWGNVAKKIAVGIGAVLVGATVVAVTATTGGIGAVFAGAVVTGVKAAALSGAVGAVIGAGVSAVSNRVSNGSWKGTGKAVVDGAINGFADGFMTGGITSGVGMSIGAIGKTSSGIQIGKTAKPQYGKVNAGYGTPKTNGSTVLSVQNNAGKRMFSLDLDAVNGVHAHLPKLFPNKHIPVGSILSGAYSGVIQW